MRAGRPSNLSKRADTPNMVARNQQSDAFKSAATTMRKPRGNTPTVKANISGRGPVPAGSMEGFRSEKSAVISPKGTGYENPDHRRTPSSSSPPPPLRAGLSRSRPIRSFNVSSSLRTRGSQVYSDRDLAKLI